MVWSYDYTDAPPEQRSGKTGDLYAEGDYLYRIAEVVEGYSKGGKEMATVTFRVESSDLAVNGKESVEYYTKANPGESRVQEQKMHAVLLAAGAKLPGPVGEIDLQALVDRPIMGRAKIEQSDDPQYPDKTRVVSVWHVDGRTPMDIFNGVPKPNGATPAAPAAQVAAPAAAAPAAPPAEVAAPVAAVAAAAPVAAPVAAVAPAPAPVQAPAPAAAEATVAPAAAASSASQALFSDD